MGVSPAVIAAIISGRNNPSYDFLVRLVKTFDWINPEWLLIGEGNMVRENIVSNHVLTDNRLLSLLEKQLEDKDWHIKNLERQIENCEKDKERLFKQAELIYKIATKDYGKATDV